MLENYALPAEFDINRENSFLHWFKSSLDLAKSEWGFDVNINTTQAICMYMGGLFYHAMQADLLGNAEHANKVTDLFMKVIKLPNG
jgi:hypothetical protein